MINHYTLQDAIEWKKQFLEVSKQIGEERSKQAVIEYFRNNSRIVLFAYVFLPHYFRYEFKKVHYKYLENLQIGTRPKRNKASVMYRGGGKTTINVVLELVYEICYGIYDYIILNSYNDDMAIDKMKLIKDEFENNEFIRYFFGDPIGNKDLWNKSDLTIFGRVKVKSMSTMQNPRGLLDRGTRPNKIISDDILDDERVRSQDQREKALQWYTNALMPAMARDGVVEILNTPLHPDDIICKIREGEPPFHTFDFLQINLLDYEGNSVDIDYKTNVEIEEMRKDDLTFQREYMNNPMLITGGIIKSEDLRYYDSLPYIQDIFIHADTTHTGKTTSDYFCMVAGGKDQVGKIYIVDYFLKKCTVEEQARIFIQFYNSKAKLYNIVKTTYDEKANQGFGFWVKKMAREEYGTYMALEELKYSKDKVTHFEPHIPLFKSNSVYLPKEHEHKKIAEEQLLSFPQKGVHDDFVDGVSGVLDNFSKNIGGIISFR